MKRRSFLKLLGISAAVPGTLLAAGKTDQIEAVKSVSAAESGNRILTIDEITREALKIAHEKMSFSGVIVGKSG